MPKVSNVPWTGTITFGELIRRKLAEHELSQSELARWLIRHLPEDYYFDATAVRLMLVGKRRLDEPVLELLCQRLGIDRAEAYKALGIWPPDLTIEGYRRFRSVAGDGEGKRRKAADRRRASSARNTAFAVGATCIPLAAALADLAA